MLSQKKPLIFKLKENILSNVIALKQLLLGRILTIIDGAIADKEQRKALKDLIKENFYKERWSSEINEILYQYDEKVGLNQVNNNELYREFMNLPVKLADCSRDGVPENMNYFQEDN